MGDLAVPQGNARKKMFFGYSGKSPLEQTQPAVNREHGGFLSVGNLVVAKKLALRRHVWFRSLSRVERGIIDLTVQCVDSIKSTKLATTVTAIISKLQSAMESTIERLTRTIGLPLTQKIIDIAQKWGSRSAKEWAADRSFAVYLAVMQINR
jgi:hypothetical protein